MNTSRKLLATISFAISLATLASVQTATSSAASAPIPLSSLVHTQRFCTPKKPTNTTQQAQISLIYKQMVPIQDAIAAGTYKNQNVAGYVDQLNVLTDQLNKFIAQYDDCVLETP